MSEAKVSVIVPIYNSEAYLSECIESIRRQTYRNLDILLIDDGSTDSSLNLCREYALKDERIRVIHQENKGVSAARNAGIREAEGEYLTFLDSDDELLGNGISVLVGDIEAYDADIATASQIYVTSDNELLDQKHGDLGNVTVFSKLETLKLSLSYDRRLTSCHGKLFRRQFLSDIRYEEGRRVNEDFYFMFLCCMKQPVYVYRNECVYKYFYRENSTTHTAFSDKFFDILYFAEKKKRLVSKHYPELLDMVTCMEVSTHLFMLNLLCKTKEERYQAAQKESINFIKANYSNYATKNKFEKKLAWIVAHGLYPIYKKLVRMKHYR